MTTPSARKIELFGFTMLVILVAATYSDTLRAPFIFDDQVNIVDNLSIRSLWPPWDPLYISPDTGIKGRPLINFTLAVNYAVSGGKPWSYHALNILIHILAALTLWGVIRRTLTDMHATGAWGTSGPVWIALGCTLLWALHPLQTQAVTYTSQRCESLMGLFFLLIFYCAVRGWQSADHKNAWHLSAILSFALGAGCKEVIAVAPVLVFLYDWVFRKKSLMETFRSSALLYTLLVLGLAGEFLLIAAGGTTSAGTGDHSFTLTEYWLLQPPVILHYIRLVLWPSDLAVDYGMDFTGMVETWPALVLVLVLMAMALWLLLKRNPTGFLSAWFFLILAPTSLYPLPDVVFEHRMYLPSIAVVLFVVFGLYKLGLFVCRRLFPAEEEQRAVLSKAGRYLMILLVLALAISTYARNLYYRSDLSIWADNVAKRPYSARAQVNLGKVLCDIDKPLDGIRHLQQAVHFIESQRLKARPKDLASAYNNLGIAYLKMGQWDRAESYLRKSLQIDLPSAQAHIHANTHTNLGRALFIRDRKDEALFHLTRAIVIKPTYALAHANYGAFLRAQGDIEGAAEHFRTALNLSPGDIEANNGMGAILYHQGDYREARTYFRKVLAIQANNAFARDMLVELDKKSRP